ncbi:MAG: electron transport complex subunit RsxC [Gammaproteobacteria bacterium]|nr:MAG: electron transport complex subunit RsxC [Gammaproteobacteria bacterium]
MINWLTWFRQKPKGLVLPEFKSLSNHGGEIQKLPIYDKYYVSLLQRDGEQAVPTVKIGDKVESGDVIARPTSRMALHRHAPTSGEVTGIVDITESHPSAMNVHAIEITADGLDTPTDEFPRIGDFRRVQKEELLNRIFRAGIAGMGGAGFPTEKKVNLDKPVDILIINGAECEPYITCDDILMRHHAKEILAGAQIFAYILGVKRILVGIEDNKPQALASMTEASRTLTVADTPVEVYSLPTQYPMGSRHQIAHYLMGKKPNINKRSYQSGFVCHNVATAKATYDAVALGKPLTERLVTFSGDGVQKPGVYATKVGSDIADIGKDIKLSDNSAEIIFGGTMMGFAVEPNHKKPIVIKRETTSVLAFMTPPILAQSPEQNCIRCGHCADVCPMDLLPQQLQFYGKKGKYEQAINNRLFDCIECGLCTYVCPSDIPLVQIFQHTKGEIINERKKKAASEHARIRFERRSQRAEAEKAARDKKAAERRAKLKQQTQKPRSVTHSGQTGTAPQRSAPAPTNRQDLIAAALARAQAKKSRATDTSQIRQTNPSKKPHQTDEKREKTISPDDKKALIAAALKRTKAKRTAHNKGSDSTDNRTTEKNQVQKNDKVIDNTCKITQCKQPKEQKRKKHE